MKCRISKKAFTIAELMIAMFMISAIAMILMPTVISDNEKTVFSAALKKTYAQLIQLDQTISLQAARGKLIVDTVNPLNSVFTTINTTQKTIPSTNYNEIIGDYSNNTGVDGYNAYVNNTIPGNGDIIVLKSGLYIFSHDEYMVIDLNGRKQPNEVGKDIFYFQIDIDDNGEVRTTPRKAADAATQCTNQCRVAANCVECAYHVLVDPSSNGKIDYY